jgi:hypothetical protein
MTKNIPLSPWGGADSTKKMCDGIYEVKTNSHGGWYVSPEKNAMIPKRIRAKCEIGNGWYEEDMDFIVPLFFFRKEISEEKSKMTDKKIKTLFAKFMWYNFALNHKNN